MSKVLQVRQDMCRKFHDFLKSHRQATCHFGPAIGDSKGDEQVVVSVSTTVLWYPPLWNVYGPMKIRMGPSSPHLNRAPPQDHCQEIHMQANNFHGFHPCRTVSHREKYQGVLTFLCPCCRLQCSTLVRTVTGFYNFHAL